MIIQKNRRVHTSSQNSMHFAIKCHREKYFSTSINRLIANESRVNITYFKKSQVSNSELQSAHKERQKF